jgi:2',3'-cyclic-nucleotide 2'-phosphodiesterase (5'-nucleotidase family)
MKLAHRVKGIDVIIGGRDRRFMRTPEIVDSTLITSGYFQGRAVGKLVISCDGPIRGWVTEDQLKTMEKQVKEAVGDDEKSRTLTARWESAKLLTRYHNEMGVLGPAWEDAPRISSMVRDFKKGFSGMPARPSEKPQ